MFLSKYKICFCFLLFITQLGFANPTETIVGAVINGKVFSSDNKPAEDVTVLLLKGNDPIRTAITNESGYFEFAGLGKGVYKIKIPFVGYETIQKEIIVLGKEKIALSFQLTLLNKQLQDVIVEAKQKKLGIGKMNISDRDLPLSTGIINNKIITDQQSIRLGDIVKNVPGVSLVQTRHGVNESYGARGYLIGVQGGAGGGSVFKNGLPYNIAGMPEAATLESVEIIKGSSAFLYGSSSGGLIINMVSKKPKFDFGGNVSLSLGSNQQYKPIIDMYGPMTKKLAYRVVGTYENDKSYRDQVKTIRTYINPSLLYKMGEKASLIVQQDYLDAQLTPDGGTGLLDSGRILTNAIPRSRFQNTNWAYNNILQHGTSLNFKQVFNDRLSLNASASIQNTDVDSYGAGNLNTASKLGVIARPLAKAHSIEDNFASQINLEGKFKWHKIENHYLAGLDFTSIITKTDAFTILNASGSTLKTYDTINLLNPLQFTPRTDIPNSTKSTIIKAPSYRSGIYFQDLISFNNKFKLFLGLRYSYQSTIQTTIDSLATKLRPAITINGTTPTVQYRVLSPKFGFVFQPTSQSSLFLSYANNFTTNTGIDVNGNLLPASLIDQFELGTKQSLLNGRLSANLSVYKIINSQFAQIAQFKADGITPNTDANVKSLSGETTSEGLELGINGNISNNLYFMAGYGYNFIRFTHTSGTKGSNIEGEQLTNAPSNTANASVFYTFKDSPLNGFKIGLSGFYTGKRYGGYNNTVGQSILGSRMISLSDYTIIDASVGYQIKQFSVQCKLSNVFNTLNYLVHDNYSITPIAPRQLYVTLKHSF